MKNRKAIGSEVKRSEIGLDYVIEFESKFIDIHYLNGVIAGGSIFWDTADLYEMDEWISSGKAIKM